MTIFNKTLSVAFLLICTLLASDVSANQFSCETETTSTRTINKEYPWNATSIFYDPTASLKVVHSFASNRESNCIDLVEKISPFARIARTNLTQGFDVPVVINKKVRSYIKYFQTRGKKHFARWLERSTSYFPMIKKVLREKGLPEDLAYIAMIESGMNPYARSHAKAVGMWQFMSFTGKKFGLRVDWWIDERRDPFKATLAAADYLGVLNSRFGSWYLAAASYNAGEGRIARAMKRYNIDDYWGLSNHRRALKRETRDYVPKYLAAMLIAKDPEKYGFDKLNYQDPVKHETVIITQATDLRVIAKASGVTLKEIRKLNPELKRWFTPPNAPKYELKVPLGSAIKYTENIKDIPKKDRLRFQRHKVKRGESLWSISRRYNTPINQIMYLNNLKRSRVIRAGKTIVVPVRAGNYKNKSKKGKRYASVKVSSGDYVVKKGDTLWDISIKYGISLNKLIKLNKLKKTAPLRPGQRLNLKEAHLQNKTTRGL